MVLTRAARLPFEDRVAEMMLGVRSIFRLTGGIRSPRQLIDEPIAVASSLRGAHPLVSHFETVRDDEWAVSESKPLLRRAMLIMNALLKGLQKRGYVIKKPESRWSKETTVVGRGHEFGVRLREPTNRRVKALTEKEIKYRNKYPSAYHRTEYELTLTGLLQLEITGFPGWNAKVLRDGKSRWKTGWLAFRPRCSRRSTPSGERLPTGRGRAAARGSQTALR